MPDAVLTGRHNGLANLFDACIGLKTDERVLLVMEALKKDTSTDHVAAAIAEAAHRAWASKIHPGAGCLKTRATLTPEFLNAISQAPTTPFFWPVSVTSCVSMRCRVMVARPCATPLIRNYCAAPFATLPHRGMVQLADELESIFGSSQSWRIRCPLGTDVSGESVATDWRSPPEAGSMKRFPVMTFQPVSAGSMDGRVALSRWLIGTGSRLYRPYALKLSSVVFARVKQGRIVGFEGKSRDVNSIEAHYEHVAKRYGLNRDRVHSWHVGLNPGTFYSGSPEADLMRWGGIAFGAPRYLHFHTCGDEAPGEICWSVFDATVEVDGKALWRDGAFQFTQHEHFSRISAAYPALSEAYAHARTDIGV